MGTPEPGRPPIYEARSDDGTYGLWWNKRKKNDGTQEIEATRLSNFDALIAVEITQDNGSGNPQKVFEIRARLLGDKEPHTFTLQAEDTATWPGSTRSSGAGAPDARIPDR